MSIDDAGAIESPDYGVDSIDDTGTGDRNVNLTTAFSSAVFVATDSLHTTVRNESITVSQNITGAADIQILLRDAENNTNIDVGTGQAYFGDQ